MYNWSKHTELLLVTANEQHKQQISTETQIWIQIATWIL